jgi:hypothetical protein
VVVIPRLVVASLAAAGALVVTRAATLYLGSDPIAHAMVLVIGGVFAVGVVELYVRAHRASNNVAALSEIERVASTDPQAALAGAPEPLRVALETRLKGGGGAAAQVHLSGYLLGLLVMLGLFGTFLGLFETLGGARLALTESADVTALRAGLAAPMRGLSRAFGTSAAGVATSALLGLAAVFVRKAEARAAGLASRLATGALFPLGAAGRQLAALEAIVETRQSLPAAARAIEVATERLAALSETLVATQRATGEGLATALDATASRVQLDLAAGIARASSAIEPLLDRAVTRAGEGAAVAVSSWTAALERDLDTRRARDDAHDAALLAASERLLGAWRAELASAAETAESRETVRLGRLEALASELAARSTTHLGKLDELAVRADGRERERLAQLVAKLDELAARADGRERERLGKLDELADKAEERARADRAEVLGLGRDVALRDLERAASIERLAVALAERDDASRTAREASEEASREREAARTAALQAWAEAVVRREEARLARLDAQGAASAEREDRRLAELQALAVDGVAREDARLARLEGFANDAAQREAAHVARLDALVTELARGDRDRLAKVDELVRALGERETERLAALDRLGDQAADREEQRLAHLEATAAELCARAERRAASMEERAATQTAAWDRLIDASASREVKHLDAVAELSESLARGASDVRALLAEQAGRLASLVEGQADLERERALAEVARERRFLELAASIEQLGAQASSELQSTASRVGQEIALGVSVAVEGLAPAVTSVAEQAASAAARQVERLAEQADQRDRERLAVIERSAEQIRNEASEAARRAETLPRVLGEFLAEEDARQLARAERDQAREASVDALLTRLGDLAASLDAREGDRAAALELLEEKLAADRDSAAAALGERLAEHAAGLAASIAEVTTVVLSAAESVKAGGGELALVAEMFTSAVDRYRQGSEQWLDTLASLEIALEKKAGGEAPDLLGAYLDRTREVFDHSLAFQRELFAELRAVKASVARPAGPARNGAMPKAES